MRVQGTLRGAFSSLLWPHAFELMPLALHGAQVGDFERWAKGMAAMAASRRK